MFANFFVRFTPIQIQTSHLKPLKPWQASGLRSTRNITLILQTPQLHFKRCTTSKVVKPTRFCICRCICLSVSNARLTSLAVFGKQLSYWLPSATRCTTRTMKPWTVWVRWYGKASALAARPMGRLISIAYSVGPPGIDLDVEKTKFQRSGLQDTQCVFYPCQPPLSRLLTV